MNDDGHPGSLGRDVGRGRHVAAESDKDIGPLQRLRAPLHRVGDTRGKREEGQGRAPGKRHARYLDERKARRRNQVGLQPRPGPHHDDVDAFLAQLRRSRQQRIHVTGGPATGHHNLDHGVSFTRVRDPV